MLIQELAQYFPEPLHSHFMREDRPLAEIRLRAGRPVQLVYCDMEERFVDRPVDAAQLRRIALSLMEHSYYACEDELARGFFTMKNGVRVGVGGSFTEVTAERWQLKAISSLCIRIAREIRGCAEALVREMDNKNGGVHSLLILSPPGKGKTTLLRDAARILSERGYRVGIADERHEIAACRDGVPGVDVGPRSDVIDGCPKARAMEMLIRTMAPQIIVTDEIGNVRDFDAVREAARMGVVMVASAHASDFREFESSRMGSMLTEGIFHTAVLLGDQPGCIKAVRRYGEET